MAVMMFVRYENLSASCNQNHPFSFHQSISQTPIPSNPIPISPPVFLPLLRLSVHLSCPSSIVFIVSLPFPCTPSLTRTFTFSQSRLTLKPTISHSQTSPDTLCPITIEKCTLKPSAHEMFQWEEKRKVLIEYDTPVYFLSDTFHQPPPIQYTQK